MATEVLSKGSTQPELGTFDAPTFITTWNCPYAQRTWIALNEKGVKYNRVFVDLKEKPEWFFPLNPYGRVPTLAWKDGRGTHSLYESLICNEFVEDAFEGPSLLPEDPVQRAQVRLLIDQFGAKVGPAFGKAIFASEDEAPAAGKALGEALTWLDSALDPTGPYAAGANFTLADAALTPFVIRVSLLQGLIGYKVPEGLDRVKAWQAVVLDRQSVKDSIVPPDPSKGWEEQLLESYRAYLASRRAA